MQPENSLRNKRVVILGGSSGIGLAVAEQAASQGARIVIASSNAERVQKAVEPFGGNAEGHALDLSDEQAVEALFTKLGAFDHLVFTAGDSLHVHDLATTDLKQARRAFELRYWAALAAVKYGSKNIRKGGSIVLTTGIAEEQRPRIKVTWSCCRQCLRHHRSADARPRPGVGANSRKCSVAWSCSNKPVAEHGGSRTGEPV